MGGISCCSARDLEFQRGDFWGEKRRELSLWLDPEPPSLDQAKRDTDSCCLLGDGFVKKQPTPFLEQRPYMSERRSDIGGRVQDAERDDDVVALAATLLIRRL